MEPLTQYPITQLAEAQLTRALARHLGSMEQATQLVRAGLHELSTMHGEASEKVAATLTIADNLIKAASYAGRINPEKEQELRRHTQEYLQTMLTLTHDASAELLSSLFPR